LDKGLQVLLDFYKKRLELLKKEAEGLDFGQIDPALVFDKTLEKKSDDFILIVGEAPGANEVAQGIPFCGMAGRNLSNLIDSCGLSRERDFLITNAFPFRTFQNTNTGVKNRTPNTKELIAGAKLLKIELEILRPKMILILGGSAKKAFLRVNDGNLTDTLKDMENHTFKKTVSSSGYETMIGLGFHPSPLVYNQKAKREELLDFFKRIPR